MEKTISLLNLNIERNKKYHDYPFTNNCDHFYRLNQFHKELECWKSFLDTVLRFRNKRCCILSKDSYIFEDRINFEKENMPGFVTLTTLRGMIEYMRKLEWKIDELNGVWKEV